MSLTTFTPHLTRTRDTDLKTFAFLPSEDLSRVSLTNKGYHKYINNQFRITGNLCLRYQKLGFKKV